jgi:hypothetical protein
MRAFRAVPDILFIAYSGPLVKQAAFVESAEIVAFRFQPDPPAPWPVKHWRSA